MRVYVVLNIDPKYMCDGFIIGVYVDYGSALAFTVGHPDKTRIQVWDVDGDCSQYDRGYADGYNTGYQDRREAEG